MNDEGESSENSGSALSGSLTSPKQPNEHGDEEIETHHGAAFKEQVALAAYTGDKTLAKLAEKLGGGPGGCDHLWRTDSSTPTEGDRSRTRIHEPAEGARHPDQHGRERVWRDNHVRGTTLDEHQI